MPHLTPEIKLLIALAKINRSEADIALADVLISEVKDWNYFYEIAVIHGIASLISGHLQHQQQLQLIPAKVVSGLNQFYLRSLSRNMILYEHFSKVMEVFAAKNIQVIPLKGIYLAETLYKDIGLRQMSDIDLLVKTERAEECIQILSEAGFQESSRHKSEFIKEKGSAKHLPPMVMDDVMVEIHYRMLIDDSVHAVDIEEYWQDAKPVSLHHSAVLSLSPEHLFQFLCIHLERHFNEGKIKLYHFVDLIGILDAHQNDFNWQKFIQSCVNNQCKRNVFRILFLLEQYFSASFPEHIRQEALKYGDKPTEFLFEAYLQCSKKDIYKGVENLNIKNLRKLKGFKNRIHYIIGDIFPSKSFMVSRYQLKRTGFLYGYYFLRMIKGVWILIRHVYKLLLKP